MNPITLNLSLRFTSILPRLHFPPLSLPYIYIYLPLLPSSSISLPYTNSITSIQLKFKIILYIYMGDSNNLPPGFRFYPSDEELVVHFLQRRATLLPCHPDIIPDLELYHYDPWDLHGKALCEGRKWYYYSRRTQSRVSESGCWKPMGVEEPVFSTSSGKKVGMKKYFMFYFADPTSEDGGSWTNWIMHEYRLSDSSSSSSSSSRKSRSRTNDHSRWVICKVFEQTEDDDDDDNDGTELSCLDEVFLSMDDYDDISLPN